jgi:transposase
VLTLDDLSDDPRRAPHRRIEVYSGSGRRRWPDDLKARIVADSFAAGAVVTEIARRHGCRPQQVHDWRRLARSGELILPAAAEAPLLVPLIAETPQPPSSTASITLDLADACVRVSGRPGVAALTDIFTALRKSRAC